MFFRGTGVRLCTILDMYSKSLPTRGSFHNLPPAISPIIEASHVLPLRPVPKIHTRWSALSSAMTCIVADEAGNGKVPERVPPAGY